MTGKPFSVQEKLIAENEDLRARLDETVETLRAIRNNEVDALIVPGVGGEQVYTLKGEDHPYRMLIEAMSEGALTMTKDCVILYANRQLAKMLKVPLEKVIGSSIQNWIASESQPILQSLLEKDQHEKRSEQLDLITSDGIQVPVSLSVSNLYLDEIPVSFGLVATDLTEQKLKQETIASERLARELLAASNQSRRALLSLVEDLKHTEEEILSQNEQLTTLYSLSRLLSDEEDLEKVISTIVQHVVEKIHITFACIALLEKGFLVRREIFPVRDLEHEIVKDDRQPLQVLPVCKSVLDKNEPVILQTGNPDISGIERTTLLLDSAQSICLVPLRVGISKQGLNPPLGLLILGEARSQIREPFTPEKIDLMRSIGYQAASSIHRMLLLEQTGLRLKRLACLREIDKTIATSFDLSLSLDVILKHVQDQLGVDAADVLVLNTNLQTLEYKTEIGFRTQSVKRATLRFGEGQAGLAALERRIIHIQDLATDEAVFAQPDRIKDEQIKTYFAIPLIVKGRVNGVLEIFQRNMFEPDEEWFDFLDTLAGQAAIAIDNNQMFNGLQRSNLELGLAYDATIEGWSHALDLRDKETEGHTLRVTEMTVKLAQYFGMNAEELKLIRWGALLHDIGKIGVPDNILLKPGSLTDEEWQVMKKHPIFAFEMISPIHYLKGAIEIPYSHHEKWDGTGYPRALIGEQIPLSARIFAAVDVYDALTSDRPYRKAWSISEALEHIKNESGKHFDPQVVDAFIKMIPEEG
jgi:PAS domain S-box-containing protein/putative nucleotidyltransferase with HDIG domain